MIPIFVLCVNFVGCKKENIPLQLQQSEHFYNKEVKLEEKETKEFEIEFNNFDSSEEFLIIHKSTVRTENITGVSEVTLPIKGKVTSAASIIFLHDPGLADVLVVYHDENSKRTFKFNIYEIRGKFGLSEPIFKGEGSAESDWIIVLTC